MNIQSTHQSIRPQAYKPARQGDKQDKRSPLCSFGADVVDMIVDDYEPAFLLLAGVGGLGGALTSFGLTSNIALSAGVGCFGALAGTLVYLAAEN